MTRKRRIDVNDIIGQVFNGMKVNKYVGDKERVVRCNGIIQIQKDALYECECVTCGRIIVKNRQTIKNCGCKSCKAKEREFGKMHSTEHIEKQRRTMLSSNKSWAKSRIKYYYTQIDKITGRMLHKCKVAFKVDGKIKTFNVYSGINKERAIMLAKQAYEIRKDDDKEKFIEWYKEVKAENGNEEH